MNINKILYNCIIFIFKLIQILYIKKIFLKLYVKYFIRIKYKNNVDILYHSKNFLVVSKPYDMYINSNNHEKKDTLQFELKKIVPKLVNPKLFHEFHFVHRLDYVTSGVICIALNKKAAQIASNAFEARTAKKFYLALLHGHIDEPHLIINKAIGIDIREKKGNHKMCVSDSIFCEKPKKSYTILMVLERGFRNGKPATKVLLCPSTGRRHQLRVHCSYIGHTVIGDYTYSERKDIEPYRTFLHSFRLIINNDIENLDIRSMDPFVASDPRNQWSPTNIARILDENVFSDISKLMQLNTTLKIYFIF
ncbi:RNA pseudouridylate synthase domain-containing protein 1-like [Apis mellifera]|uniref:RNA pseudouridylate synthase domain-containing protein 1-like n=1 Tax=Apis mellifera TaxID=7460 RepID=A0A7M7MPM1_APIME|nr:RNA pseudouridylate synthase domain-containing protein 1-like [Apis mellifera]|eukprot:XP_026299116.1 RNA pseudouridylate synthase domain-containing protein 1-like [Apis mellifera]